MKVVLVALLEKSVRHAFAAIPPPPPYNQWYHNECYETILTTSYGFAVYI